MRKTGLSNRHMTPSNLRPVCRGRQSRRRSNAPQGSLPSADPAAAALRSRSGVKPGMTSETKPITRRLKIADMLLLIRHHLDDAPPAAVHAPGQAAPRQQRTAVSAPPRQQSAPPQPVPRQAHRRASRTAPQPPGPGARLAAPARRPHPTKPPLPGPHTAPPTPASSNDSVPQQPPMTQRPPAETPRTRRHTGHSAPDQIRPPSCQRPRDGAAGSLGSTPRPPNPAQRPGPPGPPRWLRPDSGQASRGRKHSLRTAKAPAGQLQDQAARSRPCRSPAAAQPAAPLQTLPTRPPRRRSPRDQQQAAATPAPDGNPASTPQRMPRACGSGHCATRAFCPPGLCILQPSCRNCRYAFRTQVQGRPSRTDRASPAAHHCRVMHSNAIPDHPCPVLPRQDCPVPGAAAAIRSKRGYAALDVPLPGQIVRARCERS